MSNKWLKAEAIAKKVVIIAILLGASIAAFMLIPQLLKLLLPFVIGYIISVIASPLTKLFERLRLPRALSAIVSILLVAALLFCASALLVNKIVTEIYDFSSSAPDLYASAMETFNSLREAAADLFGRLPEGLSDYVTAALEDIGSSISALSGSIIEFISSHTISYMKNIPSFLIAIVFSTLASYFLIRDKKQVKASLARLLGKDISAKLRYLKSDLSEAFLAYVKAQCILMSITFVEVFIGLSILRVRYSFLFALIIAFLDAIPVFGTGTILIPWAIIGLVSGKYALTVGLVILYVVCLMVRQLLEPRILSSQIGMHPLLTLLSMYVGFKAIGVFGMILGPVVVLIIKNFVERYTALHHGESNE